MFHQKRVLILIDEYDAPLHGYYDTNMYSDIFNTIRSIYQNGVKDNSYMRKAVFTGVVKVAKAELFSSLNNVIQHGVDDLNPEYSSYFGFSQKEVK